MPWRRPRQRGCLLLRLLELLKDGIALFTGADTKDKARGVVEAIPDLVQPAFWWGFAQDVALMQGVHKHGYGSYDAVRHDAAFEQAFGIARPDWRRGLQNVLKDMEITQ